MLSDVHNTKKSSVDYKICQIKLKARPDGLRPHRVSGPEGGGDPVVPDEVEGLAGGTSCRDVAGIVPASRGAHRRPLHPGLASLCSGDTNAHTIDSAYFAKLAGLYWDSGPGHTGTTGGRLSRSRSRAGPRPHPEVRRGASRRRGMEWERPHTLVWSIPASLRYWPQCRGESCTSPEALTSYEDCSLRLGLKVLVHLAARPLITRIAWPKIPGGDSRLPLRHSSYLVPSCLPG